MYREADTQAQTHTHTYRPVVMHTYIHTYRNIYIHIHIYTHRDRRQSTTHRLHIQRARERKRQGDIYTEIHKHIHTIHTYIAAGMHTYRQADRRAYGHTYIHTYGHTYTHAYKHTQAETYIQSGRQRLIGRHMHKCSQRGTYIHEYIQAGSNNHSDMQT